MSRKCVVYNPTVLHPSHFITHNFITISKKEEHKDGYVIVPQEEYAKLYNRQYAELTTLRKNVDPEECHNTYLEAMLKKHYPQVYKDIIKNDYIMTSGNRMEQDLQNTDDQPECQ